MLKTIFLTLICTVFVSCTDLFSTRNDEVEKPDASSVSGVFEEATSPENVLNNLSRAIEQRNVSKYMDNFSNPTDNPEKQLRFIGDLNLIDQFTGIWLYEDEQNYFNNIVHNSSGINSSFRFSYGDSLTPVTSAINIIAPDDSVETDFFKYQFTIRTQDTTKVYTGLSKFKLFKSKSTAQEVWYIYYWADRAINDQLDKSWTFLKLENR